MNLLKNLQKKFSSGFFDSIKEFVIRHKKAVTSWALALIAGGMIINGIIQQPQILKNKEEIKALKEALEYEDERVEEVERLTEIVGTDEYIEKIAREKLGMVKEDEKLFVDVSKDD